ncbi:hypothetical protein GGX14DRAFT_694958 [Mycena pura]|uniref:Uncharacterized protein n=1 Tax=Mycena pura TaxID=153505 RepID=A0AAD6VSL8_9AGAR|nr:hypothetical protein GGX14DRAFT_694958 [Mycena pura]
MAHGRPARVEDRHASVKVVSLTNSDIALPFGNNLTCAAFQKENDLALFSAELDLDVPCATTFVNAPLAVQDMLPKLPNLRNLHVKPGLIRGHPAWYTYDRASIKMILELWRIVRGQKHGVLVWAEVAPLHRFVTLILLSPPRRKAGKGAVDTAVLRAAHGLLPLLIRHPQAPATLHGMSGGWGVRHVIAPRYTDGQNDDVLHNEASPDSDVYNKTDLGRESRRAPDTALPAHIGTLCTRPGPQGSESLPPLVANMRTED